jgi:hypothetical protein
MQCSKLQSIEIPESVKNLPYQCFYGCSSLLLIIFHEQIESIGNECFWQCSKLQSIEIPELVKNIPYQCFDGCSSLSSIIFHGRIESFGNGCFIGFTSITQQSQVFIQYTDKIAFSEPLLDAFISNKDGMIQKLHNTDSESFEIESSYKSNAEDLFTLDNSEVIIKGRND